jgi:hypothetical protein
LDRARDDFEVLRLRRIEELRPGEDDLANDLFGDDRRLLEGLTFESYAENLRDIMEHRLRSGPLGDSKGDDVSEISRYTLALNEDFTLGYFALDLRCLIRLACALVGTDDIVEQDLTEVVNAGYYDRDDDVCADAIRGLTSDYPSNSKQIILAEGSSDTAIIREALSLLYPHLADYFSFFDFDLSRAQGGAGQLVGIVKAFVSAGVSNRIVALFDNDTAAREARRALDRVSLPSNVAVLYYPALESLREYPTEGPTGPMLFDVNGLAASIELYLGVDVLTLDGTRSPVQWRGFSEAIGAYQGEVMHKAQLQSAFWEKVERCKANSEAMDAADWDGLDTILNAIFTAFR